MKEIILSLENHNVFNFQASTCPEGVKTFFDKNNYLLIRNLFAPEEKFSMIEKKVSNAIMKSVYCSFNGDLKLICSTSEPIKINIQSGYFILNLGDGFLYDKNKITVKIQKKLFSTLDCREIFFSY
jgi:transcriptional regulator